MINCFKINPRLNIVLKIMMCIRVTQDKTVNLDHIIWILENQHWVAQPSVLRTLISACLQLRKYERELPALTRKVDVATNELARNISGFLRHAYISKPNGSCQWALPLVQLQLMEEKMSLVMWNAKDKFKILDIHPLQYHTINHYEKDLNQDKHSGSIISVTKPVRFNLAS